MNPERWQQIKTLLQSSLEREPPERFAFLTEACGDDQSLLAEVQSLIRSHEQAGTFIESSAVAVMAESLVDNSAASNIGDTLGHFRVLRRLASGGMGEVYLTEDTRLARKVALKLLPQCFTTDAERVRRFQQEARAVSALNHPNIITIYDIGQIDSHHFIATEFIDGETLRRRMSSARLTSGEALEITSQVASALLAAHRAGIVHRDIKPENIMLRQDGLLKVLDFGLAKLIERGQDAASLVNTNQGIVMGTAHYMSPEQARGLAVDERTDIWSLGVVLYEMLAGRVPFAGETSTDVIVSILEKEPPPLAESAPEVPGAWQQLVTRTLSKDRAHRYQTAQELINDLQSLKHKLELEAAETAIGTSLASPTPAERATSRRHSGETVASFPDSDRPFRRTVFTRFNAIVVAAALLTLIVILAYLWFARTKPVATATGIKSIAVLPFKPLVVERPDESLEMGIADTLITKLSGLRQITVRPISAVRKYTAIEQDPVAAGSELAVDAVLEGSIQWDEDKRIRVTARLWRVRDRSLIWTDNWVEPRADIFALEDLITARMARAIEPTLTGTEQRLLTKHYTENVEAYQLYLKGRYDLKKRSEAGFTEAIMYFSQAITKDPQYALAYAGLADSYILLGVGDYGVLAPKEAMARAKESAKKALELDDNLAEAHASFGFLNYVFDWDWAGAETHFRRAIELNPNYATAHHWYALFLATQGRPVESIPEARQALALDPLSPIINTDLGLIFYYAHQYDQAIEQLQKTLELEPDFAIAHWRLGLAYAQKGRLREAEDEIRRATQLAGRPPGFLAALGYVVGALGKKDEAGRILQELQGLSQKRYVFPNFVANVYLGLKQNDQALNWLERAYEDRCAALIGMKVEPMYDLLRSDPRFQDLMKRVGFGS
jgi:serine/threonine-protein kinase